LQNLSAHTAARMPIISPHVYVAVYSDWARVPKPVPMDEHSLEDRALSHDPHAHVNIHMV